MNALARRYPFKNTPESLSSFLLLIPGSVSDSSYTLTAGMITTRIVSEPDLRRLEFSRTPPCGRHTAIIYPHRGAGSALQGSLGNPVSCEPITESSCWTRATACYHIISRWVVVDTLYHPPDYLEKTKCEIAIMVLNLTRQGTEQKCRAATRKRRGRGPNICRRHH